MTTLYQSEFFVAGADAGMDIYVDGVTLDKFQRNRDWVPAANLRINELRKMNVNIENIRFITSI